MWADLGWIARAAAACVAALSFGVRRQPRRPVQLGREPDPDLTPVERPARHPDNAAAAIAVAYTGARLVTIGDNLLGIAQLFRAAETRVGDDVRERIAVQLDETSVTARRGALEVREAT